MKKLTALLLAAAMCMSVLLCSCDKGGNDSEQGETAAKPTVIGTDGQSVVLLSQTSCVDKLPEGKDYFEYDAGFVIPGLTEGFIPQGFCYWENAKAFVISGYFEATGTPSRVALVDGETLELTKSFEISGVSGTKFTGHFGGAAASGNYLYITDSSVNQLIALKLDAVLAASDGGCVGAEAEIDMFLTPSFAAANGDMLWVGEFVEDSKTAKDDAAHTFTSPKGDKLYARMDGYILDHENGDAGMRLSNMVTTEDKLYYRPDYCVAIPLQVQGLGFGAQEDTFVFSTSYGRTKPSEIIICNAKIDDSTDASTEVFYKDIPLYYCDAAATASSLSAPPMSQGIAERGGTYYFMFESAADIYLNHGGTDAVDRVLAMK